MRSVIGCSCEGKRVQQRTGPHMPPPPHWRAASRGLTWRTSTRAPRRLESGPGDRAQLRALLGAVGERDARAVEADLGADRPGVLDAALAQQVAERQHGLAAERAVLP